MPASDRADRACPRLPVRRIDAVLFHLDEIAAARGEDGALAADLTILLTRLAEAGVATAAVSGTPAALEALSIPVFDQRANRGEQAAGLPDPARFLHATRLLGAHPARTAVISDTPAGVLAGRLGGFGWVAGVAAGGVRGAQLFACGADTVLTRPGGIIVDNRQDRWWQPPAVPTADGQQAGWWLDYTGVDPDTEGIRETLCTIGNGYLASRGAAPETTAGPGHYPGTYLAGLYNRLTTRVHGHEHTDESLVNVPNWQLLRWRPAGARWVAPPGSGVRDYRQSLDLRAGVLHRRYRHIDAQGRATTVVSRMFASMADPHLATSETTIVPENWSGTLQVRAGIDGRVANRQVAEYALLAGGHLQPAGQGRGGRDILWLRVRTGQSRIHIGVATRTRVWVAGTLAAVPPRITTAAARAEQTYTLPVCQGQPVRVDKLAAYYTSHDRGITEPATAARQAVAEAGPYTELLDAHVAAWGRLWDGCHVEMHTDAPAPLSTLNLHTFHLLATATSHLVGHDASVPARGLSGEGYRGHVFWDELFVHRYLALHLPEVSHALLQYRWRRLDAARRAAATTGHPGAMFPWQSGSDGREETPTELFNLRSKRWMPDRSARQRHIGLAIAYSVWQYYQATGDLNFLRTHGAELVLEIARFFADLAQLNQHTGRYEITGVTGPDEFHDAYPDADSPGLANNAYTNVMTVWLLRHALRVVDLLSCHHFGDLPATLGINAEELTRWADITTRMYVPFHHNGIITQFDGYPELATFDLAAYTARYGNIGRLDLILAAEGDSPNRYQIGKQADVLMLLYLLSAEELRDLLAGLGYHWPRHALRRTVDFYTRRVSHGSTLSRVVHSWVHARTDRAESWNSFTEALSADIADTQGGTTGEGIHLGAMAGTLDLAERCYLGIEVRDDALWLNPQLPHEISSLHTLITYRDHRLHIAATRTGLTLAASPCEAAPITVHTPTRQITLTGGQQVTLTLDTAVPTRHR